MKTLSVCEKCFGINRVSLEEARSSQPVCGRCGESLPFHDGVSEVSAEALRTLIQKSYLPVIVDFWAPWCGPCKMFAPVYVEAASQLADKFIFAKLNTENHPQAGGDHQIRGIPTLVIFDGGAEKKRISGAMPLDRFLSWLQA